MSEDDVEDDDDDDDDEFYDDADEVELLGEFVAEGEVRLGDAGLSQFSLVPSIAQHLRGSIFFRQARGTLCARVQSRPGSSFVVY